MAEKMSSSSIAVIGETTAQEHRQAYGTAKTENLRTSDVWRILLPTFVVLSALALFVIPLLILIPLLTNSLAAIRGGDPNEAQLLWVWITMIVFEISVCGIIARWIFRVFFSHTRSYQH